VSGGENPRSGRLDHLVVLMFENRSFDNLLGYLYNPGEVPSFEGVADRSISNPIPPYARGAERRTVPVHPVERIDTPDPDPGEEFPHVNTQLFGTVEPEANRFAEIDEMQAPFNAPADPTAPPGMTGFVTDYVNHFQGEMGRKPSYADYAQIMACFPPERIPVTSTLAREFACFDHWFCEVPSQTFVNRSFVHAASSSGFVVNGPAGKFMDRNDAPTIFERLEAAGRSWKIYIDPVQFVSATALIHARRLAPFFATHVSTVYDFYEDARHGELPAYSFLEPNMLHPHSDMHPPGASRLRAALGLSAPLAMTGGEQLLANVYDAIRTSSAGRGSNWSNTCLVVTFDEHGGTFDHVPPPPVSPPDPAAPVGEQGFRFDRLGVRVPTLVVSAWIDPRSVVREAFRHTSLVRTLRERWSLGPPLTGRDATAPGLAPVLARARPREPEAWPRVRPSRTRRWTRAVAQVVERPLARLERALVAEALAHEARAAGRESTTETGSLSRVAATVHLGRIRDQLFPGVANGRDA
jgi:phospholipase C